MLFLLIFMTVVGNIESLNKRCEANLEVYSNQWCYRLLRLNDTFNCTNLNCYIDRLLDMYVKNPRVNEIYEFATLKSSGLDEWTKLMAVAKRLDPNKSEFRVLINQFKLNESVYVESRPADTEHPNLMIHDDLAHGNNVSVIETTGNTCILGHQTPNNNESFIFKYASCSKELTFICTKSLSRMDSYIMSNRNHLIDNEEDDRCLKYRREYPGGDWIECDEKQTTITKSSPLDHSLKMSTSQKCCLFSKHRSKRTFSQAAAECSRFNSIVYSFKTKGYKEILENYANYLNLNGVKSNESSSDFWTSCSKSDEDETMIRCSESDRKGKSSATSQASSSPPESGFLASYLSYRKGKFKLNPLNLTMLIDYNETALRDRVLLGLVQEYFLLGRRKPEMSSQIRVFTVRKDGKEDDCFRFTKDKSVFYLSLPYLQNCYHFAISDSVTNEFSNMEQTIESMTYETLQAVLNTLGVIDFSCEAKTNVSGLVIAKHIENCSKMDKIRYFGIDIKRFDRHFNRSTPSWLSLIKEHLVNHESNLILHSYSPLQLRLEVSCTDRLVDLVEQVEQCLRFYDGQYCIFTCPEDCFFGSRINLWQFLKFKYSYLSSLCKAAKHSNINSIGKLKLGYELINDENKNENPVIFNNGIYSYVWPPIGITNFNQLVNTSLNQSYFYFEDSSIHELSEPPKSDVFVLVKSIYPKNTTIIDLNIYISNRSLNNLTAELNQFADLDFSDEISFQYEKKQDLNNEFSLYKLTLNLSGSKLNNYLELTSRKFSIKFPINFEINNDSIIAAHLNTILLNKPLTIESELKLSNSSKKHQCYWHINEIRSQLQCINPIELIPIENQQNDISYVIYPKRLDDYNRFIRVVFVSSNSSSCLNRGVLSNSSGRQKCQCWPGFSGPNCESSCPSGYFGPDCELFCPNRNCSGLLVCSSDPIGCQCASGWDSTNGCVDACASNRWGPDCFFNCSHCHSGNCDRFSGKCVEENCTTCRLEETNNNDCDFLLKSIECPTSTYSIEIYETPRKLACIKKLNGKDKACSHRLLNSTIFNLKCRQVNESIMKASDPEFCQNISDIFKLPAHIESRFESEKLQIEVNYSSESIKMYYLSEFNKLTNLNETDNENSSFNELADAFSNLFALRNQLIIIFKAYNMNLIEVYDMNITLSHHSTNNSNCFSICLFSLLVVSILGLINKLYFRPRSHDYEILKDFEFETIN